MGYNPWSCIEYLWLACFLMLRTQEPARGLALGQWSREMRSRLGGGWAQRVRRCVSMMERVGRGHQCGARLPCSSELCGPAQVSGFSSPGPSSAEWRRQRPR